MLPPLRNRRFQRVLRARFSPAARDYFARLDAASLRITGGGFDKANAYAIDRLVANGGNFWPDSGAFCAMAGYLFPSGGTLIPLKDGHDAGTLNAFVTGDWDAVTGLKGDGSTKYVDSNRNNNADGQNDQALGAYVTADEADFAPLLGAGNNETGTTLVAQEKSSERFPTRSRSSAANFKASTASDYLGLISVTRGSSAEYILHAENENTTISQASEVPYDGNLGVFCRIIGGTPNSRSSLRLPFYHIGPNLNGTGELAELDSILTDWQTDLANA